MSSHLEESTLPDGRKVITVSGELDRIELPLLRRALSECFAAGVRDCIVDLSDVTYLDSSVLAALISESLDADTRGGRLSIVTGRQGVMRTLELKGLIQVMHLAETLDDLTHDASREG
jgi:anti-sigma B factor antagonist